MFDHLIECQRKTNKREVFAVRMASLVIHTMVVAAVAYATLHAGQGDTAVKADSIVFIGQPQRQNPPEQRPPSLDVPLKVFQTVLAPEEIPNNLPPVDLQPHFNANDYLATQHDGSTADPMSAGSDVFSEAIVEEKPSVLSGSTPVYPEFLRQAGIQGRVIVQAVIDTLGRAEPTSVKILLSPNLGFDQSARDYVLKARLRPARVHGRAVRVLINIPIEFRIAPAR